MDKKQHKILELIFKVPIASNVRWKDVEALLNCFSAEISEGNGSRVRIDLNGVKAVFHRPHPSGEIDKGALKLMQKFLMNAGIDYDEI